MSSYDKLVLRGKAVAIGTAAGLTYKSWSDDKLGVGDFAHPAALAFTTASFRFPHVEHAFTGWLVTQASKIGGRGLMSLVRVASRAAGPVGTALVVADALSWASDNPSPNSADWGGNMGTQYQGDSVLIHLFTTSFPDWLMSSDRL